MTYSNRMKWSFYLFFFFLTGINLWTQNPVYLQFNHKKGQVLHADSVVNENVYINRYFSHQAEIDEFSVSSVVVVSDEGVATLDSSFRTVERVGGVPGVLEWISSETVRLDRDSTGKVFIPEDSIRPVLRNVPRFPAYSVKPGDNWSFPAEEVHLIRIGDVLYGPYRGTTQVVYNYLDNIIIDEKLFARIYIEYSLYLNIEQRGEPIRLITGKSKQELLWDINNGCPESRFEDFEFLMMMTDGITQEFKGSGNTSYRLSESINRSLAVESLSSQLQSIPGIIILPTNDGILLSVNDSDVILFEPESSVISENQLYMLEELASSLEAYSDRDILVSGHTADYGTYEGRRKLSRDRAAAVADILFPGGRSGAGRLFLRGIGNRDSLGSDHSNRRVEILILD